MVIINSIDKLNKISLDEYSKIKEINFSNKKLKKFPTKIFNFTNLQVLLIKNNEIKEIPKEIKNLTGLRTLILKNNKIKEIPKEICKLSNLRQLNLENNYLTELPKEIYELKNLAQLNFGNNKLTEISDKILQLNNLKFLKLEQNKLTYLPNLTKIKKVVITEDSYEEFDNLSLNCEYLQISGLTKPLTNLPATLKEIRLYDSCETNIKIPFDCKLYIDNVYIQ